MGCFESHYRAYKGREKEEAPEGSGFLEDENSH